MKESLRCPKCQSTSIVHLAHVADAAGERGFVGQKPTMAGDPEYSTRRHIALEMVDKPRMFGGTRREANRLRCPTEAYVCTRCGYLEEYVVGAAEVNWDLIHGASFPRGEPEDDGPFR